VPQAACDALVELALERGAGQRHRHRRALSGRRGRMTRRRAPSLAPGAHLNNMFEIVQPIAADETGEVYEARNIQTKDPVAIRVVRPELARGETILEQLRKEARILVHLHHDAIARYHVVSTDTELGVPFLAMELVKGPSLGDRMEAGPLEPALLASLQQHLAEGLEKAHRAGVIHRHLAPDRIVLPDGRVDRAKIIDFGVRRGRRRNAWAEPSLPAATTSCRLNSSACSAARSPAAPTSTASGWCSLPAPSVGRSTWAAAEVEAVEKRRSVPDLTGIDPPLRDLLEAMLQPDPRDRPQSMAEVADWPTFEKPEPDAKETRLYTSAPKSTARPPSCSASADSPREDAEAKTRLVVTALAATAILLAAVYFVYW
jgi:serine/threonine protein kinase